MRRTVVMATAVLMLAACGKKEAGNAAEANAMVTEMSAAEALEGTTNDSMTNIDAAAGSTDPATLNSGAAAAIAANAASESDKPAKSKATAAKPKANAPAAVRTDKPATLPN